MARKKLAGKKLGRVRNGRKLSSDEQALFDEFDFRYWGWISHIADADHVVQIRRKVNPKGKHLRLYYPGSGSDIVVPLLLTDANEFVFVDQSRQAGDIEKKLHHELNSRKWSKCRLEDREISHIEESYVVGKDGTAEKRKIKRTELEFVFNGRPRLLIFYDADPDYFIPQEADGKPEESNGFDIIFFKKSDKIRKRDFLWMWEMLGKNGSFLGMGDFTNWRPLFKNWGTVEVKKNWNYEGSTQLAPYLWTVLSKKKKDTEMSDLVQKHMKLVREKKL